MWVPFNEGWGQFDTARVIAAWTKELDPTRLVDAPAAGTTCGVGDVHDIHVYPGPGRRPSPKQARAASSASSAGWACRWRGTPGRPKRELGLQESY